MAKIDFSNLFPLFEASKDFSLTESQYENSTGRLLPKNTRYLLNKSALAKTAKKYGYVISVTERTISLKKVI